MDHQDYWAIAERDIEIQNPVTDRKLRLLDDYCDIRDGLSVLDIGCGKAWLMRQWAERYAIRAPASSINPRFLDVARDASRRRAAQLDFVDGPRRELHGAEPAATTSCSASAPAFALGGFVEALDWMAAACQARRRDRHRRPDAQASARGARPASILPLDAVEHDRR